MALPNAKVALRRGTQTPLLAAACHCHQWVLPVSQCPENEFTLQVSRACIHCACSSPPPLACDVTVSQPFSLFPEHLSQTALAQAFLAMGLEHGLTQALHWDGRALQRTCNNHMDLKHGSVQHQMFEWVASNETYSRSRRCLRVSDHQESFSTLPLGCSTCSVPRSTMHGSSRWGSHRALWGQTPAAAVCQTAPMPDTFTVAMERPKHAEVSHPPIATRSHRNKYLFVNLKGKYNRIIMKICAHWLLANMDYLAKLVYHPILSVGWSSSLTISFI